MNHWPDPSALTACSPHQRERYARATAGRLGILGGNPGAGKTYTTAQIIQAVLRENSSAEISVCAPTGKAAQRITEVMREYGLHLTATTIHRLLHVQRNGHDGQGWGFGYHRRNKLPDDFLFIDESSMLGTPLAASLFEAIKPTCHVLLIGDFAQLPPVEHGAPLRDMIAAGVPYGELEEIRRNAGAIVRACLDVKEGRPLRPSAAPDIPAGENLVHLEAPRPASQARALGWLLKNVPGLDPVWDCQVLCATNDSSEVSRQPLNTQLQQLLNPDGERLTAKDRLRVGDKVICTSNQMLPTLECPSCQQGTIQEGKHLECDRCGEFHKPSELRTEFVANGEIGQVRRVLPSVLLVDVGGNTFRVVGGAQQAWDLAYAITTHKSQGSQWPVAICLADDSYGADRVTSWEWHRTAWSRAEKLCFTVGRLATIHRQCRRSALRDRKTFLKELVA